MTNVEKEAKELEDLIRKAEDELVPLEGTLRLLARSLPQPPLADVEKLRKLLESVERTDSTSSVKNLIRAMFARKEFDQWPTIEIWPEIQATQVLWSDKLDWLVYPPRMAWPCIKVRAYCRTPGNIRPMMGKSFRLAGSLIDHSLDVLNDK